MQPAFSWKSTGAPHLMTKHRTNENAQVATLEIMKQVVAASPFNGLTQSDVTACADGFAEIQMPFDQRLSQHHGFLHGGLVGFLADTAMSWAAASVAGDVLTAEFRVHLLSPGKGERFIGRGHVIKAGRRQIVTRSNVFAVNGNQEKLIATATGTIMPVPKGN